MQNPAHVARVVLVRGTATLRAWLSARTWPGMGTPPKSGRASSTSSSLLMIHASVEQQFQQMMDCLQTFVLSFPARAFGGARVSPVILQALLIGGDLGFAFLHVVGMHEKSSGTRSHM